MGCGASVAVEDMKFLPADVERAVTLSRSGIVANQRAAITTILNIASSPDDKWRVRLVDAGCLDSVVAMLRCNSKTVQLTAAKAIAKLALAAAVRARITHEGAIPPLVEILKDTTTRPKMVAMDALHHIALHDEARPRIVAEGAVAYVLELMTQESLDIELAVLGFLARLSQHPKSHARMGKDLVIPPMFEVVKSNLKSVSHKRFAVVCLAELAAHSENHKMMIKVELKGHSGSTHHQDGLEILVALLAFYSDDIKTYAAVAIGRLAENPTLRHPLVKHGCVPNLVSMMKSPKMPLKKNATLAICALSHDPQNQVAIIKAGALPPLIHLSRCGHDTVEAAASLAIATLASNTVNRPRMLASGAFKPLVYNARFGHTPEIKHACMLVLASLFHTQAYRKKELVRKVCEKFKGLLVRKRQQKGITGRQYRPPNDAMGQDDGDDGDSQASSDGEF